MEIEHFPLDSLIEQCADHTTRYLRKAAHDTRYCMELFRRALVDGVDEALEQLRLIYEPLLLRWVYAHPLFHQTGEIAVYFSSEAFVKSYRALRGQRFFNFPSLAHIVKYMKACVHTSIIQYLRDQRPDDLLPEDFDTPDSRDETARIEVSQLWEHITSLMQDDLERLLAHCTFVLDMKPREITQLYPSIWPDERSVTIRLYRIRQRLRNDSEIRRLAGNND
jgi:hypothetical protein